MCSLRTSLGIWSIEVTIEDLLIFKIATLDLAVSLRAKSNLFIEEE
jgi:hypothetical protein